MPNIVPDHPVIRNLEETGYPDGKESEPIAYCDECGEPIMPGYEYYKFTTACYCDDCVRAAYHDY